MQVASSAVLRAVSSRRRGVQAAGARIRAVQPRVELYSFAFELCGRALERYNFAFDLDGVGFDLDGLAPLRHDSTVNRDRCSSRRNPRRCLLYDGQFVVDSRSFIRRGDRSSRDSDQFELDAMPFSRYTDRFNRYESQPTLDDGEFHRRRRRLNLHGGVFAIDMRELPSRRGCKSAHLLRSSRYGRQSDRRAVARCVARLRLERDQRSSHLYASECCYRASESDSSLSTYEDAFLIFPRNRQSAAVRQGDLWMANETGLARLVFQRDQRSSRLQSSVGSRVLRFSIYADEFLIRFVNRQELSLRTG